MSLRVWLPLNGNLDNQGLDQVTVTNNGAVIDNNGKIGKCYSFDGSDDKIQISNAPTPSNISIAMWFKRKATTNTRQFLYTQWQGITLELDATNKIICSVYSNGSQCGYCRTDDAITINSGWVHICFVFKNGVGTKLYINGLQISYASLSTPIVWGTTVGNIGYFSTYLNACINDFRIYDHALSPLEVKQISQGLILHYPLNRNGWGNENLLSRYVVPGQAAPTSTAAGGRTTWLGDYKITIPATQNADTYFRLFTTKQLTVNATYTISCKVDGLLSGSYYRFPLYAQSNTAMGILNLDHNGLCSLTFTMTYGTQTAVTGANGETVYICFMDDSTRAIVSGQGAITISNFKLEEGDKATPWCPNSSDELYNILGLNNNIQYDTSGYGNNGTKIGISYSSDTPKYNISTVFDNNTDTVTIKPCYSVGQKIEEMSCSIWFKTSTLNSTAPNQVSLGENSFFRFRIASATSTWYYIRIGSTQCSGTFSCKNLIDNQWHHIVVIFNKGYVYVYVDSNLIGTGNHTSVATYMTCNSTENSWHLGGYTANLEPFIGNESDFRIYATALSAEDVLSLYNNSAYIDNQGNIYGAVYEEV